VLPRVYAVARVLDVITVDKLKVTISHALRSTTSSNVVSKAMNAHARGFVQLKTERAE
jgi:hypothetical protein